MKTLRRRRAFHAAIAAIIFAAPILPLAAQDAVPPAGDATSREQEERELIAVLQSDAPLFDKDAACRRLAVIGTKEAVPALAALLTHEQLCDIARHGLEPIPDSSVDGALRAALPKVEGRLLVGVITSIGNRRDAGAVPDLVRLLGGADQGVAAAAARALGKIGGARSATALERALEEAPETVRPAVAHACLWCARTLLVESKRKRAVAVLHKRAVALLDRVRKADLPPHILAAATRNAVLGRGPGGLPLLLETLRSDDQELFGIGLRLVREMPAEAMAKVVADLDGLPPAKRDLVIQAVTDRGDAEALLPPPDQPGTDG